MFYPYSCQTAQTLKKNLSTVTDPAHIFFNQTFQTLFSFIIPRTQSGFKQTVLELELGCDNDDTFSPTEQNLGY